MSVPETIKSVFTRTKKAVLRKVATLYKHLYQVNYWLREWKQRYGGIVFVSVLLLLVVISFYVSPLLQDILEDYYGTEQAINGLRSLIQNVGTALLGAAAIVTSLVLFAMQVNIERMPHGLFRRLSADSRLLGAFALAFLLAITVSILSTLINQVPIVFVVIFATWAIIFILALFMYAYRRALTLINPLQQLGILITDTRREFRIWAQRAKRAIPLLDQEGTTSTTASPIDSTHDLARTIFFQINKHWTDGARRATRHAMSFARRYAEHGDHEVSRAALNTVVAITKAYIDAKGKTFYANNLVIDNPLATDGFINDTLEHLRQNIQNGIARQDEQQIEQTLQVMATLVQVYLGIDYSNLYASKSHAHIAAGYLASAIESVVPHNMADVLLEGQRLMGRAAQYLLVHGRPEDIVTLSEKIALIACTGYAKKEYRPVTMVGVTQLADLTFALLCSKHHDIRFAVEEVRRNVALVVKLLLKVPDTPLLSSHSTFLGSYYSSTNVQSLRAQLVTLVNAISEAEADNEDVQTVIRNIEQWANNLYQTEKELLLEAIKAKSHFTFDIIHWITGVTEILLAVSNAEVCYPRTRDELRKHARRLINTLTWIPEDMETVTFIENFQITEILFKAAMDAHNRGIDEVAKEIGEILLFWTFKGGRYQTGWGVLERGLCGAAVFALLSGGERIIDLMISIEKLLSGKTAPEQEVRDRAARQIRDRATSLYRKGHWSSLIEMEIAQADHEKLRLLLEDIAEILSPGIVRQEMP
ncbi:hypothetical protein [Desulforhopalus singaporensis]|uniref:DUF2254 domain-containing protein n=1 Tax=Desulforhopalus singaporensis TaxID=91360 RepID=A0A1H0UVC2_9BACT|nr:hypothetical protein [Desulforhopalus singaporensis]SDP70154.1 hypothetical protein SAMN05660330_03748 [Desulforhopalus singaporensis]